MLYSEFCMLYTISIMKRINLFFAALLIPLDYLVLVAAACFAYYMRYTPFVQEIRPVVFDLAFDAYIAVTLLSGLVFLIIFALSGLYTIKPMKLATEFVRIVLGCSAGIAVVLGIAFFSRELFDSRFIVLAVWGFTILFVSIERFLIRMLQRSLRNFGVGLQRVVIIGKEIKGTVAQRIGQAIRDQVGSEVEIAQVAISLIGQPDIEGEIFDYLNKYQEKKKTFIK